MRLVSWNVNSIRSHHHRLVEWIERHQPDVVALQETKCNDAVFAALMAEVLAEGYEFVHHGHDHWNGVAILSRVGLDDVRYGFSGANRSPYDEARVVSATCGGIDVHSLYAPNGRSLDDQHYLFKLVWLERLRAVHVGGRPTAMLGDFNVAPTDADIYDPVRWRRRTHASPPERAAIEALVADGLRDVTREHLPESGVFTWWSYRPGQFAANRGLRIDLALCSDPVADRVERVWIDTAERADAHPLEKPSDHAPLVLDLT
ncbi:MAG: exodeoxyribonuclease III [Acidimicrobiaceae bacterium]|nr:exodeoxyribonuclease III [Acidimicrobiaceae bacterium]